MKSKLFVLNADFEIRLGGGKLSEKLVRSVDEMACLIAPALENGDRVLSTISVEKEYYHYLNDLGLCGASLILVQDISALEFEAHVWGWNVAISHFFKSHKISFLSPSLEVVKAINSRLFSYSLMREYSWGVPYTERITTISDLEKAIALSPYNEFVLKPLFGQAGAGFIHSLSFDKALFEKRLLHGEEFIFEPWLSRKADFAMVLSITSDGAISEIGFHQNICNRAGAFVGTLIAPMENRIREAVLIIAQKIAAEGYFGVVGIDGFSYIDREEKEQVAVGFDINGRYTMSWIAHKLHQKLKAKASFYRFIARRRHKLPANYSDFKAFLGDLHYNLETKKGVILTSPLRIIRADGLEIQPSRSAFMVVGESEEEVLGLDEELRKRILK